MPRRSGPQKLAQRGIVLQGTDRAKLEECLRLCFTLWPLSLSPPALSNLTLLTDSATPAYSAAAGEALARILVLAGASMEARLGITGLWGLLRAWGLRLVSARGSCRWPACG